MKTKIFTFFALYLFAISLNAQVLVATLTHNGATTAYYGTDAFSNAVAAADHGDMINLSAGTFVSDTVKKAITIHGAGVKDNSLTTMSGKMVFDVPLNATTTSVKIEGILFPEKIEINGYFDNATICRCHLRNICTLSDSTTAKNLQLVNCLVLGIGGNGYATNSNNGNFCISSSNSSTKKGTVSVTFINCFLQVPTGCYDSKHVARCENCIVGCYMTEPLGTSIRVASTTKYTSYNNCILFNQNGTGRAIIPGSMTSNSIRMYNVSWLTASSSSEIAPIGRNCTLGASNADVFKSFTGTYTDGESFALTDSMATAFLGDDGKQVGLYGGYMPYTEELSYPQITRMDVAPKSTPEGKLNVNVEVSTSVNNNEE